MLDRRPARRRARRATAVLILGAVFYSSHSAAEDTSVRVTNAAAVETMTVAVAQPVRVHLNLPGKPAWREANIGRFVARTRAVQRRIDPTPQAGNDFVECTFDEPGAAMLVLAAGPPLEKGKSDAWQRTTHCTRMHLRVTAPGQPTVEASAYRTDPGETAKLGLKIEVLPLMAPTTLRIGDDFPVRAYFNGSSQKKATVAAHRPDGSTVEKTTDSIGSARFKIDQTGKWIVRFERLDNGTAYVGDLVFEVPTGTRTEGGSD